MARETCAPDVARETCARTWLARRAPGRGSRDVRRRTWLARRAPDVARETCGRGSRDVADVPPRRTRLADIADVADVARGRRQVPLQIFWARVRLTRMNRRNRGPPDVARETCRTWLARRARTWLARRADVARDECRTWLARRADVARERCGRGSRDVAPDVVARRGSRRVPDVARADVARETWLATSAGRGSRRVLALGAGTRHAGHGSSSGRASPTSSMNSERSS